jgi:hypothetical protein
MAKLAMSPTLDSEILVFADKERTGWWRVEYFDDDGGCYITIFAGPKAERRARDYTRALRDGALKFT